MYAVTDVLKVNAHVDNIFMPEFYRIKNSASVRDIYVSNVSNAS